MLEKLKQWARQIRAETFVLYLAARDPRTPWYVKLLVAGIVAYAFSPIDLIPDFVPVLGYLDDLILIPLGIAIAIKLVPQPVLAECRIRAQQTLRNGKPVSWVCWCHYCNLAGIGCALHRVGLRSIHGSIVNIPIVRSTLTGKSGAVAR